MDDRTKLIHAGKDRDPYTGASAIPIYQISTYDQADPIKLGVAEWLRSVYYVAFAQGGGARFVIQPITAPARSQGLSGRF